MNRNERMEKTGGPGSVQELPSRERNLTASTGKRRRRFWAPRHSIAEFDDHLLADIGLTRADANGIDLQFGKRGR